MLQTKLVEKIKTHFVFSNFFFFENRAVYEMMWKNIVEPDRPQMTIRPLRVACWIPKATNTHSGYVIRIASPLQQRVALPQLNVTLHILCLSFFE